MPFSVSGIRPVDIVSTKLLTIIEQQFFDYLFFIAWTQSSRRASSSTISLSNQVERGKNVLF